MNRSASLAAVLCVALSTLFQPHAAQAEDVWQALKSGRAVALLRHALAPGTTDPANFKLNKCGTQRNLSAEGRAQARRIGAHYRKRGISDARVLTSAYCRCRDTAKLLGFGSAASRDWLNALAKDPSLAAKQTASLAGYIASVKPGTRVILVTHKWNIARLTGITPSSGEAVVVRAGSSGGATVIGRIPVR